MIWNADSQEDTNRKDDSGHENDGDGAADDEDGNGGNENEDDRQNERTMI